MSKSDEGASKILPKTYVYVILHFYESYSSDVIKVASTLNAAHIQVEKLIEADFPNEKFIVWDIRTINLPDEVQYEFTSNDFIDKYVIRKVEVID